MPKTLRIFLLLSAMLSMAGCSDSKIGEMDPAAEVVTVEIGAGPEIGITGRTRTAIEKDGITIRWAKDDRIALWARRTDGQELFSATPFTLSDYGTQWQQARFRGDIPSMDESEGYRYYAVSPVPESTDGTRAVYTLPSIQDGEFHGQWDIMVASPVGTDEAPAPALVAGNKNEAVAFSFRHRIHLLRIEIPENHLGEKITSITLNFPVEVVGKLSVDATDPSAAPLISEGSKQLTLRFAEPKDVGDIVYATIAPVSLDSSQPVTITATGTLYESEPRTFDGKDFAAGHTTPIAYRIPAQNPITQIRFSFKAEDLHLGEQTLGERINSFTLRINGAVFDNGLPERTFTIDPSNTYDMSFPDYYPSDLIGKEITILYDSEHALVSRTFSIGSLTEHQINPLMLPGVPYLFEEDFSSVTKEEYNYNSKSEASANTMDHVGLMGWTGARWETSANTGLSVSAYAGSTFFGSRTNVRFGRVDTSPLPVKEGENVSIRIAYSIGGTTEASAGTPRCYFGITTKQGTIDGTSGGDLCAPDNQIDNFTVNNGGSYTNLPLKKEYTVPGIGSSSRLSWCLNYDINGTITSKYFYLYLDDIRVSIVPDAR